MEGYKPLIHRGCGGQLGWVKEHVQVNNRINVDDLLVEGAILKPNDPIALLCDRCHDHVNNPYDISLPEE